MSAQFFQSNTPQENQTIKCNDAIVRGAITCSGATSVGGSLGAASLDINGASSLRKVTFDPSPVLYTQTTDGNTAVAVSGAEECFDINTVSLTTAAGAFQAFNITHSGVGALDMVLLTQISYSGTYNVNGALMVHVAAVSAGVITVGIKNWGTGAANGPMKLRFKLFHNSA